MNRQSSPMLDETSENKTEWGTEWKFHAEYFHREWWCILMTSVQKKITTMNA